LESESTSLTLTGSNESSPGTGRVSHADLHRGRDPYCEARYRRGEGYAARFAAKEAARKALGAATSIAALGWRDVEIISSGEGAPHLELHGRARALARQLA
jgi:phosphopantetheine--protein transferase-like protein